MIRRGTQKGHPSQEAGGRDEALWQSARVMERPPKFAILAAFAALYLIWGSTYLGILFAIQSIPPFLMAGVRFFLVSFGISLVAHFAVGAVKSLITIRSWWASGLEMTWIGVIVAVVTYGLGLAFGAVG